MKRLVLFSVALLMVCVVFAQSITDSYRPGGFDYNGASIKTFSVSDTTAVQFSRGNLQYNPTLDKWRFSLRQYQFACNDNANIAQDYDGWIDLFCWGTSGWNSGATAYQPWATSLTGADYYPGGSDENSLTGTYANADWGIYNKIENGGRFAGMWRTLTKDEWEYLVGSNTKRNGKWGLASIEGIYNGVLLLPDEWTLPTGCSYTAGRDNGFKTNKYTYAQWEEMQLAGAIFLPAAGYRFDTDVYEVGGYGGYWSSTCGSESDAWEAYFGEGNLGVTNNSRHDGRSVRLVRRVQTPLANSSWVDMGLPSGTLWYSCNIGTTKPQGYGAYFAWGETKPKSDYRLSTYAFNASTVDNNSELTKYCDIASYGADGFTDNLTTLEPSDDAARIALGGDSRMPSETEWRELIDNCTIDWTKYKGVTGSMLTSKINGERLFLPASGVKVGTNVTVGSDCYYWSNKLNTQDDPNYAIYFYWNTVYIDDNGISSGDRWDGLPVRPVRGGVDPYQETTSVDPFDENGASLKKFTVAEGRTVSFSKGNLKHNPAEGKWYFAENQYDYIGADNSNISETYDGWIDLFGWGTSGWASGANAYQPWATSTSNEDYYVGGSSTNSLTGEYANADWGVYNAIIGGGNAAGMWRTLTKDEWLYLLNTRSASTVGVYENARYAMATVNGVAGLILLPDSFTMPSGVTALDKVNVSETVFTANVYTTSDWAKLESAGAIFLPAAGHRFGVGLVDVGTVGSYWSSTGYVDGYAYGMGFNDGGLGVNGNYECNYGQSVRLVKD